jgi:hypothetical protein
MSLARSPAIAEHKTETPSVLTLSDISTVSSSPQSGKSLEHCEVRLSPQEPLSLSIPFVVAEFGPVERKQELHTIPGDGKECTTSEALQVLNHEDTEPWTSSSLLVISSLAKQHDEHNDTIVRALDTVKEPLLPERTTLLLPGSIVQGASVENQIVNNASGDEHHPSRSRRVRCKRKPDNEMVFWSGRECEEESSAKIMDSWNAIQPQCMEVQHWTGLTGVGDVIQYNEKINAVASKSAKVNLLVRYTTMLDHLKELVAKGALSKHLGQRDRQKLDSLKGKIHRLLVELRVVEFVMNHRKEYGQENINQRPVKRRKT